MLATCHASQEYDVLGLGQLMIDYAAAVDDEVLAALDVPKGGRRCAAPHTDIKVLCSILAVFLSAVAALSAAAAP